MAASKPKAYKLVLVKWEDHASSTEWKTPEEVSRSECGIFLTVGWLVHEDRKTIKVCQCIEDGGTGLVGNESIILKKCIVSRHELELT